PNIFIVTFGSFGGGRDDRLGQAVVLTEPVGQQLATNFPFASFVFAPGVAYQVTADDHLHLEWLALVTDGYAGIRHRDYPVRYDIFGRFQGLGRDLIEHLAFVWNRPWQHHVESRNPIRSHHDQVFLPDRIHVAHLPPIKGPLAGKIEIRFLYGIYHDFLDLDYLI